MVLSIFDRIKVILRGRHNSIKYKFLILPKDYAIELLFRLTGRRWLDFYRYRMNREANKGQKNSAAVPDPSYIEGARQQYEYLCKHGLRHGHKLLDYGCGIMRLCIWVEGSGVEYFGVDISDERIALGRRLLQERGIKIDSAHAVAVGDYELSALKENNFDFIWAQSVYTHMPVDEIVVSMRCLKDFLKPDGKFLFTFSPAREDRVVRLNQKDWWQPPQVIEACARRAGFEVKIDPHWNIDFGDMAGILTFARA